MRGERLVCVTSRSSSTDRTSTEDFDGLQDVTRPRASSNENTDRVFVANQTATFIQPTSIMHLLHGCKYYTLIIHVYHFATRDLKLIGQCFFIYLNEISSLEYGFI